jgi:ABC-type nitrate/sulfonate/bicarbonate transport system substrate-binding protein
MMQIKQILFVPPAPVVWAEHLRLFAQHGVQVETTQTLSSDHLGQGLADGTWDVGVGVVDNIIAWNEERKAGLQIMAQLERSMIMAFCAVQKFASLADAASDTIAVDATTNGFVLVLYRALSRAGIDRRKCRYETVGGVRTRFESLTAGKAAATILVPPFIDMALAKGFRKLWDGADIAPAYPGVVVAARAAWLRENEDAAFAAARYSEGAAQRLVREAQPGLEVSPAGWDEVVELRRECGLLPSPEPSALEVINRALLAKA